MSTGARVEPRLVGDRISRRPNRETRRGQFKDSNRKTILDLKTGKRRLKALFEMSFLQWDNPHFRTKNTPLKWVMMEIN